MSDTPVTKQNALHRARKRLISQAELSQELSSDLEQAEVQNTALEQELVALQDGQAKLVERARILEVDNDDMSNELDRAYGVQRSLLPQRTTFPGVNVFCHLETARLVGGDFYDLLIMDEEEHPVLVCIVADVAGKGIAAALMMSLAIGVLREATRVSERPHLILERANQLLMQSAPDQKGFVSAAVATLDLRSNVLHFAGAGHEAIIWLRKGKKLVTFKSTGPLLGIDASTKYKSKKVTLHSGDRLVMYTDGLTEAVQPGRRRFGSRRLHHCIQKMSVSPLADMSGGLLREVLAFRKGEEINDDLTLLTVEVE